MIKTSIRFTLDTKVCIPVSSRPGVLYAKFEGRVDRRQFLVLSREGFHMHAFHSPSEANLMLSGKH